jgi:REP element-mobilizing transposase RayT
MAKTRRREIRLDADVYRTEGQVFSVTIGTLSREPVFKDLEFGLGCIEILKDLRAETESPVYAYCLMPDHVHLLAGVTKGAALPDFIGRWKSLCYQERRSRGNKNLFLAAKLLRSCASKDG